MELTETALESTETAVAVAEVPAVPAEKEKKRGLKLPGKKGKVPGKRRRWPKVVITLIVIAVAGYFAINHFRGSGTVQGISDYLIETAAKQDLTVSVTGTATLEPADSYNVTTLLSGEIKSSPFEEGDLVSKDDLLFSMDSSSAQNSVESAALSVKQRQLDYQAAKEAMYPTATITGTIDKMYVKNGDTVTAGTQICRIVASTDLYVDFLFDATPAKEFTKGQAASIYFDGFDGSTAGTVSEISASTFLTSTGREVSTVRIKVSNPGVVEDSRTCYAEIGSYTSYGDANISYNGSSTVYASGSGNVVGFKKLAGDKVTAGENLCTISSDSTQNTLQNAQMNIKSAQISQSTSADTLDDYNIKSPIAGTVIAKNFKAGDTVKGMDSGTLAVIYDLSYLKLVMNVDELDISKVAVGQKVKITVDALDGQMFQGVVDKVSINGTTNNGVTTYPVTINIQDYGALLPGMNASVTIMGETDQDVLCIPVDAVSSGNVVMVPGAGAMSADNTTLVDPTLIETRQVTLGRNDDDYIEVTSGLEEGDIVLIQNQASSAMSAMMGG